MEDTTYDVYFGLDVGKTAHHGCALITDGTKIYDKALPQDEDSLRSVFDELKTYGSVLLIVDQRRHHRRSSHRRGKGLRLRRGLPARLRHEKGLRPVPQTGEE